MQPATQNADCPEPLPLFRPEALAARQNLEGHVLTIRTLSLRLFVFLAALVCAAAIVFGLVATYAPMMKSSGALYRVDKAAGPRLQAIFYVPEKWTKSIQPGSRLQVRCSRCSHPIFLSGTVAELIPATEVSSNVAQPEPVSRVTVILSKQNSSPRDSDGLQPGATLEAEFPLQRRPVIQWLMAWSRI